MELMNINTHWICIDKRSHNMTARSPVFFLCLTMLLMCGCASVKVKRVSDNKDDSIEGVRFYRPLPYLLVSESTSPKSANASGIARINPSRTLEFTVVWMPDVSEEYAIQAKPGLGTVEFNPTLENGWNLIGLNAKVDSKASELLTAIASLTPKGATTAEGLSLRPGMYPFIFDRDKNSPNYGRLKGVDLAHPVFTLP